MTKWTVPLMFKAVGRGLFILCNNLYAIPTFVVWMLLLRPLLYLRPAWYLAVEGTLFRWLLSMVGSWLWTAGYTVAEAGEDVSECFDSECLILVNHISTADVPVLMYSTLNKGHVTKRMHWIMDNLFKYTNFGIVSQFHGDFFILQGKETRDLQLKQLRDHLKEVYIPRRKQWIMLFPEGGFLRKRRQKSQEYARKYGYPVLENVTLPRVGAMQTILETLSPTTQLCNGNSHGTALPHSGHLKWVIDITLGYPDQTPLDAATIIAGHRAPCQTTLYYRKYPIHQVPQEEDALLKWLYQRYAEKDKLIERFNETGRFPDACVKPKPGHGKGNGFVTNVIVEPKVLPMNLVWIAGLNILFLSSTLFHGYLIQWALSSLAGPF